VTEKWLTGVTPTTKPVDFNTNVPHSARIWNYWLGGKDNFAADRAAGDQVQEIFPGIARAARAQRDFLGRAVRYLAGEAGIRQFLDIGTGLPTVDNTHEVAQRVAAESRIVYVDNDPIVLTHARALLSSTTEGATDYVEADLRDSGPILEGAARTLDLAQPTALILLGILGHISGDEEARSIVSRLLGPLPPGSYLVIADGANVSPAGNEAQRRYNEGAPLPYHLRSPEQISRFFEGLELAEPGVVSCTRWRPDPDSPADEDEVEVYGGVARKRPQPR
jgi:O-methyltransferase involved in polyketide biosynthesis